jgi:hypothetical protein
MSESTLTQKYNATTQTSTAYAIVVDTITAKDYAVSKIAFGAVGSVTYASAADPLPVTAVITGTVAATQSGTWTVDLGATDNAVLDAIAASAASADTKTPALGQALAAASVPVVLTAAQVTTLTPPAAITGFALDATLGTLSAKFASGTVIGDVNLGATDNAVLDAIAASLAGTLTVGSHAVTNGGTFAVQVDGNALTALQKIDDSVFVDDAAFTPATSSVNVSGYLFDDTSPDSVDEGDAGAARMSANRCQYMQIRDGSSFQQEFGATVTNDGELVTWNNSIHGDNTALNQVTAIGASRDSDGNVRALRCNTNRDLKVTIEALTTNIAKAEDAAHASGDTGVFALAVRSDTATSTGTTDGDYSALITDANGRLHVIAALAASQTLATVTTVGTVTTCSTVTTVSTLTGSGVAHDGADSGNPHKIGAKAKSSLSAITLVSADDRTDLFADLDGIQVTRPHCHLGDIVSGVAAITDGSSTSVIASQGAGVKTYITSVVIANTSATAVTVDIRDGAAGSVKLTLPVPADTAGVVFSLPVPLPFSAATAVCADPSAAASTVTVSLIGFRSKV